MSESCGYEQQQAIFDRVHELMSKGKASGAKAWSMNKIVDIINKEFGPTSSVMARLYIVENYQMLR
tara:strand:- start:722 stop:919 length:198 start_codon:yes stop_codon:yes gene_type:complete